MEALVHIRLGFPPKAESAEAFQSVTRGDVSARSHSYGVTAEQSQSPAPVPVPAPVSRPIYDSSGKPEGKKDVNMHYN